MRYNARVVALLTLLACEKQGAWSDGYLKNAIREAGLDRRDAAFCTRLCYGVLQNQIRLDWYLERLSSMKLSKMQPPVIWDLRMGLYQLVMMDRVPARAAVNEAVALAQRYAKSQRAAGMVNAILRTCLRRWDELPEPEGADWAETMSIRYSHPRWLVEEFRARLGEQGTETLLAANNAQPPIAVQVNTLCADAEEVLRSLINQGVQAERHPWLPDCLTVSGTGDLERLESWQKGWFYVQDGAARLAAMALGPIPGEKALDCCAAPGGKSFALAVSMENRGQLISCDIHPHKLKLIEAGRDRLGLSVIETALQNGAQRREEWLDRFDRVLVDVPCSGFGIIRKKPDIRYKDPEPLAGLPEIQYGILNNSAGYVKPGGLLVYATCTLLRRENEGVAERFLAAHPEFAPEGTVLPGVDLSGGMLTLWPHRHGTDGFFIARLRKRR